MYNYSIREMKFLSTCYFSFLITLNTAEYGG